MQAWRTRIVWRTAAVLLAFLLGLPSGARADDDAKARIEAEKKRAEAASARYARQTLIRRAQESVRPDRMEEEGV